MSSLLAVPAAAGEPIDRAAVDTLLAKAGEGVDLYLVDGRGRPVPLPPGTFLAAPVIWNVSRLPARPAPAPAPGRRRRGRARSA